MWKWNLQSMTALPKCYITPFFTNTWCFGMLENIRRRKTNEKIGSLEYRFILHNRCVYSSSMLRRLDRKGWNLPAVWLLSWSDWKSQLHLPIDFPWLYSAIIPNTPLKLFLLTFFPLYPEAVGEFSRKHGNSRFKSELLDSSGEWQPQRNKDGLTDSLLCLLATRSDVP